MFRDLKVRFILLVVTIILMFSLSINYGICQEAKYKFNLVTADSTWETAGIGLLIFSSAVRYLTAGDVDITIFPNGEWGGSPEDNCQSVELGDLDMAGVNATPLSQMKGGGALEIFNIPFIFKSDIDEVNFVFESENKYTPIVEKIVQTVNENANYVLITLSPNAARDVFSSKPLNTIEDLEGLKIRTMGSNMQVDAFKNLGALPIPMPYGEVYTALQLNTINAMENSPSVFLQRRFFEVAPYYLRTSHYSACMALIMSKKAWNTLPSAYQSIFKTAGVATGFLVSQASIGSAEIMLQGEQFKNSAKQAVFFTQEEHDKLRGKVLPKLLDKYGEIVGMNLIEELAKKDEVLKVWYEKNK